MTLEFETRDDTLTIIDPVERVSVQIRTDPDAGPTDPDAGPAETDSDFTYPVDEVATLTARHLTVNRPTLVVLDDTGDTLRTLPRGNAETLEPGTYCLQVADDIKTYLRFQTTEPVHLETAAEEVTVDFGDVLTVDIGARSTTDRPTHTVTTSTAPRDLMRALSTFGVALKDTGPMRSFPSLRGHPPTLELGDELHVPEDLQPPDTGVTIRVPPDYAHIFPVASLATYLGATIEPGDIPRIETDAGFTHRLTAPGGYEDAVARTLRQVLTLDAFVRSVGPYGAELSVAPDIAEATGLDADALYDRPLAEQLAAYLEVPWEVVQPFVPRWSSTAYVDYTVDRIPHLPFLADDLAIIRTPAVAERRTLGAGPVPAAGDEFTRATAATDAGGSAPFHAPAPFADPDFWTDLPEDPFDIEMHGPPDPTFRPDTGSAPSPPDGWDAPTTAVVPEQTDAQDTLWLAEGIPIGASKPTIDAFRHALDRDPVDEIEVLVVCNDPRMAAEDTAVRRLLSADTAFDVHVRPFRALHTDELEELLSRGADFLHYIGHIDEAGFVCPDGHLDAAELDEVNVDACLLNACSSYEQGQALVDAGAIASIVTLTDVLNSSAVEVGTTMARLLNSGFPLSAALDLAAEHRVVDDYTLVGDGAIQITENPRGATYVEVESLGDSAWVNFRSHICPQGPIGSMYSPHVPGMDEWYLHGYDAAGDVPLDDLERYLADSDHPVRIDGRFGWSSELRP